MKFPRGSLTLLILASLWARPLPDQVATPNLPASQNTLFVVDAGGLRAIPVVRP